MADRVKGGRGLIIPSTLVANARVGVRLGANALLRRAVRFVSGQNVTLSLTDDPNAEEAVLTVTASGGGGGGGGTPASSVVSETSYGQQPAVGTSTDYARGDHTHGTPPAIPPASSVVSETSYGQSSQVGTSTNYARADHSHGTPAAIPAATTVVTETSFGQSSQVGTSGNFAREDHSHGTPTIPAHSSLSGLAWSSSGHTGSSTAVATWDGSSNAQALQATADETMLARRGGILQWVAIPIAAVAFTAEAAEVVEQVGSFADTLTVYSYPGTIT